MKQRTIFSAVVAATLALPCVASAQEERILWISIGDAPTNLAGLTTKINAAHADGFNAVAAGSSQAVLALTNVDGSDSATARFNLDALRLRLVDQFPLRVHGRKFDPAPVYTFKSASAGNSTITLSGATTDGFIEYSETASNANSVGLNPAKLMNRKFTITADPGLTFSTATITLAYNEGDLNGLTEDTATSTALNTVWKSNGVSAVQVNPAHVSFNFAANTVTITNQTGFSDWFLGNNTSTVPDWMMLLD